MSWYYACKKVKAEFGDGHEYTVVEVFPELPSLVGELTPHTENTTFYGKSPEELVKLLRTAADDIERHGAINEKLQSSVGDKDYWINRMDEDE